MARYTHCTFFTAFGSSTVCSKNTYDPKTGAMTVPTPLNACEILIRISAYRGGPHTTDHFSSHSNQGEKVALTCNVWVRSSFKGAQTIPDNENGGTETSE